MIELKTIWTISKYTFIELMKSRVIYNTLFLGFGLICISYIAAEFAYGVPQKVALDFGMGALSLSACGIALFLGGPLIKNEVESRTIQMILSRPVKRESFIFGRVLGMSLLLALNVSVLGLMTTSVYFFMGGEFQSLLIWTILFSLLESIILLNVVVLFSMFTTTTLSVIYTIIILILGHNIINSLELEMVKANSFLEGIIKTYSFIFPDLTKLNIKDFLLYDNSLSVSYLLKSTSYGLLYSGVILVITAWVFGRKDLE
ncbi:MAG: ABC transporter permease [Bacteriovoracaceae bacterium]|nr:ABC transporter permease [Bacteriovoracaceae bacterium]